VYITLYEKQHRKRLELDCSAAPHPLALVCLMRLYLDDLRITPTGFDVRAFTAAEAIEVLKTGNITFISFDHDLGEPECGTGYDVAKWIEEQAHTNSMFVMPDWTVHSGNPVGAGNIQRAMLSADRAYRAR
jgi:hypothetical protein